MIRKSKRLYQNPVSGLTCLISGLGFALLFLSQLLHAGGTPGLYVGLAVLTAYFVAFRLGRGGLLIVDEGVIVRNPLKTSRVIPPEEIRGCVLDDWHGLPEVAFLILEDGKRIAVPMLEVSPLSQFGRDDSVHKSIAAFNKWLGEQRDSPRVVQPE